MKKLVLFSFLLIYFCTGWNNLANAKVTDVEKQMISQAIYTLQGAATDIVNGRYNDASSKINVSKGQLSSVQSKITDNKLLVAVQLAQSKIAGIESHMSNGNYSSASTLSLQTAQELQSSLDEAVKRGATSSGTTPGGTTGAGVTGQASGSAGVTTPKSKTNEELDSGIKVIPGESFDVVLGTWFNPLEDNLTVAGLIVRLINILLMLVGMVAVVFIIFGGIQMVTASGNESRVLKGKQTVIYAVAGLLLCLLSFSIVAIIQGVIS